MLPGKFLGVVVDFNSTKELLEKVQQGYLKASWRDGETLKTGYVLVSAGQIMGALVEDVLNGTRLEGESALEEMSRVSRSKKVRAVELYEADVTEILRENPSIRVENGVISEEIPGWDLDSLLLVLTTHRGELRVHNGGTSWRLYLDKGVVRAAQTIRGPALKGNEALKNLLWEIGKVIKDGRFETGGHWEFTRDEEVHDGGVFTESVHLLKEKRRVDNAKGF
ncbi:DUF2226 domain-containing protein [Thermococcus sp. 21S9]|uniref:DUF2226 domain-containing protein n=1 Tax=Thermococcus sp. 21S9 TaxID=1638223 RepID=UPI00143BBC49|nr:DUF2226 domain-containing protein [Thermococcus sp. 21S9]NJE55099.1 DUF2226 domain-containing protein [Thermococcus sp. 21S9]